MMAVARSFSQPAQASPVNRLINPDFARVYAAQPQAGDDLPRRRWEHQWLPAYPDGVEPFLPYGWTANGSAEHQPVLSQLREDDRAALRVRTGPGERLALRQQFVEVIPGHPYTLGLEVRGHGSVRLMADAQTPGPVETLARVDVEAGNEWTAVETPVQAGAHRRLARLSIEVGPDSDVQVRGARLETSADTNRVSPEERLTRPAQPGEGTLFFEDFDGETLRFPLGEQGELSPEGEGRFGKGLIVSPDEGGVVTHLDFGALPEKGTISFWFRPARLPSRPQEPLDLLAINTRTPGLSQTRIVAQISPYRGALRFGFRKGAYAHDWALSEHGSAGWGRWQPDTWHHVAGSWDGEVVRLYVDGVLEGILYGDDKELPRGEAVDLVLRVPGMIDEILLEEGLPFGPVLPAGAEAGSYRSPAPESAQEGDVQIPDLTPEERRERRAATLSALPEAGADYLFSAERIQPAWKGMDGLRVRQDHFGEGAHGVEVSSGVVGQAAFWSLEEIDAGDYYLGIWLETTDGDEGEYSVPHLNLAVYRNGYLLELGAARDPVQVKRGVWLTEVQTLDRVSLEPGDAIALIPGPRQQTFHQLALYREEPKRGHGVTGRIFGLGDGAPLRLRLVLSPEIQGEAAEGEKLTAVIAVANPLPYEVRAEVDWTLADHFGAALVERTEAITLAPHTTHTIRHPFLVEGKAHAYQLSVRSRPAEGFKFPVERPADRVDLYSGVRAELVPNLPDPLTAWNHTRVNLDTITSGFRRRVCLGGTWQRADLKDRRVPNEIPDGLDWDRVVSLPFVERWVRPPRDVFGFWYRRTFRVPEELAGQRLLLEVEGDRFSAAEGTVFLNGNRIGGGFAQLTTLQVEIPREHLRSGEENELVICTRGTIALMHPDFVDRYAPGDTHLLQENQHYPGHLRHQPHLGPVRLVTRPSFAVRQVLPLSEPEKNRITLFLRVQNAGSETRRANLEIGLFQSGQPVSFEAKPLGVELEPGEERELQMVLHKPALQLYSFLTPVSARLEVVLEEEGRVVDRLEIRFGYRHLRVEGTDLILNGRPFRFFGYGPNFNPAVIYEMENDLRATRILSRYAHRDYDLIGDIGVLNYRASGFNFAQRWKRLNNEEFWDAMRRAQVEQVWEYGAHPALIGWNLSNESYHYAPYTTGSEGQERHGALIFSLAEAVRDRFGFDFWFLADGDSTLGGRLDFCSFHYLNNAPSRFMRFAQRPENLGRFGEGVAHYTPDGFYLNLASEVPRPGTVIPLPGPKDWAYGDSAFADTESYWTHGRNGIVIANYIGDAAAVSSALQSHHGPGMAWTRTSMEGYRDMGATGIKGMYWRGFFNLAIQAVSFILPEMELRYYSGARVDRRITFCDDEFQPGTLRFRWALKSPSGKTEREGHLELESDTAFLHRDRIVFDLPEVVEKTAFTLTLELRKDGRRRAYEERLVEVWPPLPADATVPGAPHLAVYDPSGVAGPVLRRLGVRYTGIPDLSAELLSAHRAVLIGPGVAADDMHETRQLLKTFAAGGGRVLLLAQEHGGLLPLDIVLERKMHTSIGFVRIGDHPVMKGLEDQDFQFWNPGHVVARGAYHKPDTGVFRPLVDAAYSETMAWSLLLELPVGKGWVMACQLPLLQAFETEPMAAELLGRLLAYLGEETLEPEPSSRLAVLSGATDPVLQRLNEVRAEFVLRSEASDEDPVLLVDLSSRKKVPEAILLRRYLEVGNTLVVRQVRPEHAEWLTDLTGRGVTVGIQPYKAWADRQMLRRRDGLVQGLNNLDFYWRPAVPGEAANSLQQVSRPPAREVGQVEWVVSMEGAEDYLFPGGLVEVPVGRGRLVVDQVRWTVKDTRLGPGSPTRILTTLLTNLGVARQAPPPAPFLPPGVRYVPLDITGIANRSFRDEQSGDGLGWLDWGPDADLREFPTGEVRFHGVPFRVPEGQHNAAVLRVRSASVPALKDFPDTLSVKVNRNRVAGLVFLHTGGWAGGREFYGRREMEYADGTVEVLNLNETNTADWNPGKENFPDETGSATRVAWTGANPQYPVIRVYQTLWVNPHPEKELTEVRVTNADLPERQWRFVPHLGITVALLPDRETDEEPADKPEKVLDAARSLELLNEALALVARDRPAEADTLLERALAAAPRNIGAWIALAQLRSGTAEPEEFRELVNRWMEALPDSYQAYNLHGGYLEKRGRQTEALEAYRRSLDLEWNQPDALQAVQRLERDLRP